MIKEGEEEKKKYIEFHNLKSSKAVYVNILLVSILFLLFSIGLNAFTISDISLKFLENSKNETLKYSLLYTGLLCGFSALLASFLSLFTACVYQITILVLLSSATVSLLLFLKLISRHF